MSGVFFLMKSNSFFSPALNHQRNKIYEYYILIILKVDFLRKFYERHWERFMALCMFSLCLCRLSPDVVPSEFVTESL